MSFSSSSGGTLALPSPTTSIHGDTGPAARNLRRSMSRSPSRFHLMRAESHNSQLSDSSSSSTQIPSPCPQTHTSTPPDAPLPSSLSTSSLASSGSAEYDISSSTSRAIAVPLLGALQTQQSIFSTPLRSSLKLSVRSARPKTTSSKPASRPRLSPKSPLKRALSVNSDMGNSAPPSPARAAGPSTALSEPLLGQENGGSRSRLSGLLLGFNSPPHNGPDKQSRHSMHLDLSRDARADTLASTICSPLKRSDAIMNFDHSNAGSPVAKRRSLHGIASLGTDFNVFDFASPNTAPPPRTSFDIHDDSSYNHELGTTPVPSSSSADGGEPALLAPVPSGPAKRASSLRKSTFQRHDSRSSWGRRQGEKYLAQQQQLLQQASPSAQAQPKRASHEWLFTTPHIRNKPRASLDQLLKPEPRDSPFKGRGPLPNPSLHSVDQHAAPTGAPAHHPHPLSRTLTTSSSGSSFMDDSPTHFPVQLPPDRPRPTSIFARSLPLNTHRPRPDPVSTPQYKSARPLQSVFASAGLVSKMNKNGDDEALQREGGKPMVMPDTPCKKQVYPSNTYPPSSGSGRKQQQRRFFFSVGSEGPGPFNNAGAHPRRTPATNAGENVVNFFKLRSSHARKGSILSIDGDASDSQGAVDGFDLPPTPTKSVLAKNLFGSANKGGVTPIAVRDLSLGSVSFTPEVTAHIPSPITGSSPSSSSSSDKMSPKTPREHSILHSIDFTSSNMAPPDASRLSISNNAPRNVPKASISLPTAKPSQAIFPPATPTTDREAFINFMDRRVSITPVHGKAPKDTDAVLSSMFGKVECVGKGEFSQVYRVNARNGLVHRRSASFDYFSLTPSKRAPSSRADNLSPSSTPKVFAVKKVRLPYFGQKEREAKLREVAVLEAVRGRENVLQISDHWEQNGHLYIQTEYCDEGGLDSFLKKVGEHGRLDDFRIWKILLEVSQGLRYVHDAGFIHLDLKPANIFVTYEGHLKIGDFGMAASWPAPKGIEGEGDREYMGPEILQGKYDKPADIFALGLIVLEIACNVFLPDNGPIWVALREGDMSVVPSLTAGEANALVRDAVGMPIVGDFDQNGHGLAASLDFASTTPRRDAPVDFKPVPTTDSLFNPLIKKPFGQQRAPEFMVNQHHAGSLDSVVARLISVDPARRPTVHEILEIESLQWVHTHRRAPATIFEGNWGPDGEAPAALAEADTEMTDV